MTVAFRSPPEKLLEEPRWLRGLAARLAGPDDADDAAQATWLRALEQRPGWIRGLRPWLRTVLRNTLLRSRRSDAGRRRRELEVVRIEAEPSTAELAARASLHRAVADAVSARDEPGRSVILLRFFEGCPAGEIARRRGVPEATVRTQIRRALGALRSRLDSRMGGRELWTPLAVPVLLEPGLAAG